MHRKKEQEELEKMKMVEIMFVAVENHTWAILHCILI